MPVGRACRSLESPWSLFSGLQQLLGMLSGEREHERVNKESGEPRSLPLCLWAFRLPERAVSDLGMGVMGHVTNSLPVAEMIPLWPLKVGAWRLAPCSQHLIQPRALLQFPCRAAPWVMPSNS